MIEKVFGDRAYHAYSVSKIENYISLTKPRLLASVILSAVLGFVLPMSLSNTLLQLIYLLFGTALMGGGANALNQWMEQVPDSIMYRTKNRALPTGKLSANEALSFGIIISVLGFIVLLVGLNALTAGLGMLTLLSYILVYTPLKQKTVTNTWFGGITGALPPVMGWAQHVDSWTGKSANICILYFWQLPHFFAIAWMYRDDYKRGGFKMLSHDDQNGRKTAAHMFTNCLMLYAASIAVYLVNQGSLIFLAGASALGLIFFAVIVLFFKDSTVENARKVFLASIIYLPLMIGILVLDRFFI
ncbi:MAG: protoheme IX farnesyltransferase [Pseudomonadota bacterium]|nr:MAG: protoheme IX farnesyltransferase [Pseudomonadota bacterium]